MEDQLFRFSRILDTQPRLAILLGNYEVAADARVQLLRNVLASAGTGVNAITTELLAKTVELLRRQPAEAAVRNLAEAAVARRGEVVAQVSAAAELSDAQHTHLTEVLSRIYGHPVTAQVSHRPRAARRARNFGWRRDHRRYVVVPAGRGPDPIAGLNHHDKITIDK